jgi:hypothetical protein
MNKNAAERRMYLALALDSLELAGLPEDIQDSIELLIRRWDNEAVSDALEAVNLEVSLGEAYLNWSKRG